MTSVGRKLISSILKVAKNTWFIRFYLILLAAGIGLYTYQQKDAILALLKVARIDCIVAVVVFNLLAFSCYSYVHFATYRTLQINITFWQTFQITAFSRMGVYLPGKVWYLTNYYLFSKQFDIESEAIGKNFVINNALLFFTGAICSLFAFSHLPYPTQYFLMVIPFLMVILVHPRTLDFLFDNLLPKLIQFSKNASHGPSVHLHNSSRPLSYTSYLKFIAAYFLLWIGNGLGLFLCVYAIHTIEIANFPLIMAAGASGLLLGLLALFAPAGIGVREGLGAAILSQIVPLDVAILASVIFRLCMVLTDLIVGSFASVNFYRIIRSSARAR